jgi:hypothetical protein
MNVVLLLLRTRLRRSWRSAVVLVVLIGLGGSVALAVAAGARRTASGNDAILEAGLASDISTTVDAADPQRTQAELRSVADVAAAEVWVGFRAMAQGIDPAAIQAVFGFTSDDLTVDRPFVTSGRLPTGEDEGLINPLAAERSGLTVGSHLQIALADASFTDFEPVDVEIVGIGIIPEGVIEDELAATTGLFLSRALTVQHLDRQQYGAGRIRLVRGDIPPVTAGLAALGRTSGQDVIIDEFRDEDRARVQRALQPLLWALGGLAGLAGAATVLVAAQAIGRTLRRRRGDDLSLAAMGCSTRQLVAADLAFAASVTAGGILVALALAVAASPLFPVGPPRQVDAIRGLDVDHVALGLGSLALGASTLVMVGATSWRRRTRAGTIMPGRAPGLLGARPASATGLRLATGRRGTLSTVAGVCAGLATVMATLTFTGSLDHLAGNPPLVGMSWDVIAREGYTTVDVAQVQAAVTGDPTVRRVSGLGYLDGEVNGAKTPLAEVRAVQGDPWPPIVAGRVPRSTSEVLVGRATLRFLNVRIGDEVRISLSPSFNDVADPAPPPLVRAFTVVGSAVSPAIGLAGFDAPRLDVGVLVAQGTYEEAYGMALGSDAILFDLTSSGAATDLRGRFPEGLPDQFGNPTEWFTSAVPAEISQADEARTVIWLAVAALATAVVATIAHTLLGFVRQRRRDYAVLKAVGFTRGQVRTTVLWQSGAVLAVALVAALPLGAAAGRWMWRGFAGRIGVVAEPVVPVLLLGVATLLSVLAVQGVALIPASIARRTPPGRTLHGE